MWRFLWEFLKFAFKNGPTFGFWLGVIIYIPDWFIGLPAWVKMSLYVISVVALFFSIRKIFRGGREIVSKVPATTVTSKRISVTETNKILALQKSIPSNLSMKSVYAYAKNYAKEWASDGQMLSITYYIELEKQKTSQRAQIFIRSKRRNEFLTTYLPGRSDNIEEGGKNEILSFRLQKGENIPKVTSYKGWQKKLSIAIEKESANIAKADEMQIQISPSKESLDFTFYFKKDNRKWKSFYKSLFQEGSLELKKRS